MTFEKLNKMVEFTVIYKTIGTLSIGASDQPFSTSDSPIIRLGGLPVIPGSSLKGAIRSNIEGIFSNKKIKVCVPDTAIPRTLKFNADKKTQYLQDLGRKEPCDPQIIGSEKFLCPVCQMFGAAGRKSGLSGRVIITDALLLDKSNTNVLDRTHVAIARNSRSQAEGSLMEIESVDIGTSFQNQIRLVNPKEWMIGAVIRGLEWLEELGIGAKKTSGYGQLEITIESIIEKQLTENGWQEKKINFDDVTKAFDSHRF